MRARLVSRVITGLYDAELRPFGIKASQLNVLVAIAGMGPVRRTDIARYMQLDTSTLSRNLRVMETNGWIEEVDDAPDGRGAPLRLTSRGEALLGQIAPAWRSAQRRASRLIGKEQTAALREMASSVMA